jgi:hypothetical protein
MTGGMFMPGSIGEEDDITRGIKRRTQMYDMARKSADADMGPVTGKMGTKKVKSEGVSENLSHIANKRFKTS